MLFRGKRKDNGEWIKGFLFQTQEHTYIAYDEQFDDDLFLSPKNIFIEVEPRTVTEFTGLYDKNDKEIWEGDVVTMPAYGGGKHTTFVYFKNGKFAVNGSQYHFKDIHPGKMEVIGTIFDEVDNNDIEE